MIPEKVEVIFSRGHGWGVLPMGWQSPFLNQIEVFWLGVSVTIRWKKNGIWGRQ